MKRILLIIVAMLLIFSITGCNVLNKIEEENRSDTSDEVKDDISDDNNEEDIDEDEEKEEEPPTLEFGGVLRFPIRDPQTLNPLYNTDRTVDEALKLVFDPLFTLDDTQKPIPHLIDTYEVNEEGMYITLKVKEGILFHDGEELHADDVIYTIDTLRELAPENSIYKVCVENYYRVSQIDEYTLRIYFEQPFAFSLYSLIFPIIPQHYNMIDDNQLAPIGTGAYRFVDYTSMKELNLTANREWFLADVNVENIQCIITREPELDTYTFNQRLVDLINPSKYDWQQYADKEGVYLTEYTTYYYDFIGFNHESNLLSDAVMRKAIAYAIDRDAIVDKQYLGHAVVTEYPLYPDSWLNEDNPKYYQLDLNQSESLLKELGWEDLNNDDILEKIVDEVEVPLSLRLLVNSENITRVNMAKDIEKYLEEVGFVIEIEEVEYNIYQEKMSTGDYDLVLSGWKLSPIPNFSYLFHSEHAGTVNFVRYRNEEMDMLLSRIFGSVNEDDFILAIDDFKNLFVEDLPYFSLYFKQSAIITNDRIYGELNPNTYYNLRGIENLYIIKEQ